MRKHQSLVDLSSCRRTRSQGPPPVQEKPLPATRRRNKTTLTRPLSTPVTTTTPPPTPPTTSPLTLQESPLAALQQSLPPPDAPQSPPDAPQSPPDAPQSPPDAPHLPPLTQGTPPPPISTLLPHKMEEELRQRVADQVKKSLEIMEREREEEREQRIAERDELEGLRAELLQRMEQGATEREDQAHHRERQATNTLSEVTAAIKELGKEDSNLRKPCTFSKPTLAMSTSKFFTDYQRYIRARYPNSISAAATYLSNFLSGKAFTCYNMQPVHIKDDYEQLKGILENHFQEMEEDLENQSLKPHDPKKQTIEEYLDYAQEYFMAKQTKDKEAIKELRLTLAGPLQRAITINKPKTWQDACRDIRNAANTQETQNSDKTIQSIVASTFLETAPTLLNKFVQEQTNRLATIEARLEATPQQTSIQQETHTVAAMGGGKPTYHKPSNATRPQQGQWPSLPQGHQINPRYTGKPEDYDPFFGTKMKKLREQGLIPPGSRFRNQQQPRQQQQWTPQQPQMLPPQWQQQQQYTPQNPYNNNNNPYNNNNSYNNNNNFNPAFNPYQNGGPSNNNSSNQGNPNTNNPALTWPQPYMMPQSSAPKPQGN